MNILRKMFSVLLVVAIVLSLSVTALATEGENNAQVKTCEEGCTLTGTEHDACVVAQPKQCEEGCTLAGTEHDTCVVAQPKQCEEGCTLAGTEHDTCVVAQPAPQCGLLEGCADGQHNENCAAHDAASCITTAWQLMTVYWRFRRGSTRCPLPRRQRQWT